MEKSSVRLERKDKKVTFFDFKGLMAPVFTCFKDDENCSLETRYVDRYAAWLKSERITGVLVNSVSGEGPALGLQERKQNNEAWWRAASKYELITMIQIGGAPLPDVLELASQAETLGVHAVLCLPELFYKPNNIQHLLGYCKIVAKKCNSRPFFYYHIPRYTGVDFDMVEFCTKAEEVIPNFFGLLYSSVDLDMGARCLRDGRVLLLGASSMLACGFMLGFESALMTILNIRPDLAWDIYTAVQNNDLALAKYKQGQLNKLFWSKRSYALGDNWVSAMKAWFNDEHRAGFSAGPARKFY